MKSFYLPVIITTALISSGAALAEQPNNTPHALACMKKYGFTYAQWRAYAVPADKAEPYRACRDAGGDQSNRTSGQSAACQRRAGFTQAQYDAGQTTPEQRRKWDRCMGVKS